MKTKKAELITFGREYDKVQFKKTIKKSSFDVLMRKNKLIFAIISYSERKLLILDEPTSNMDIKNERKTYEILKKIYKDKCIIIVSHRLLSVFISDEIILLKNKKIIASKSHEELYSTNEYYRQFYKASRNI